MRNRFARLSGRSRAVSAAVALFVGLAALAPRLALAQPPTAPPPPPPPPEVETPTSQPSPTPATGTQPPPPTEAGAPSGGQTGGGRYLLLPDISLVGIFKGHLSTDKRDLDRQKLRLDQAEIAVQSYVYPEVKLDTFIVFDGGGGVNVEEAYLSYLKASFLKQTFTTVIGRRKVPFGRVNQLHPHAWLYAVQPYVLTNLVAEESLAGDGGYVSYLFPTNKIFAQLDLGYWSQSEKTDDIAPPADPTTEIITSPGAGFADKFGTARLWLAKEALGGSVELGGSLAQGRGVSYSLNDEANVHPDILLTGTDLTFRRAGSGTKRLLLRAEYLQHRQTDGDFKKTTNGWYAFADQRLDPLTSVGIRYDESGFPYAPGTERGISLIGTRQLTEVTLYRLQLIHGSRPGKANFDEIHFELVFGVGPHTHNLE